MDCAKKTFLIIGDVPYGKHLQMLLVAALNISNKPREISPLSAGIPICLRGRVSKCGFR